ncbi:TVP38/TMEM64 family protein [Terrimonas alba]|uniref:TVP38/TMEM64 family protein n=1 Tax=Terrimonas alba TaxID=3349636 RepID=UPI0035F2C3DE
MKKLPLLVSLSALTILVSLYFIIPSFQNFIREAFDILTSDDEERIGEWVARFKLFGPVVIILIMVLQMFLFIVPNVFVMMVAIISYGPFWGAVISFLGVFASSSIGYLIGNRLGPVTVHKLMSEKVQKKTSEFIRRYGVTAIAITRISSFSNDSLSIVAGLLKMRYSKYILATLGGITPLIVLLAIYGKNGKILSSLIWIAVISFIILIIYIIIDKKKKKKKATSPVKI